MSKLKPGQLAKIKKEENLRAKQRNQVLEILKAGHTIAKASGNGTLSFNQRSLYYIVRALVPGLKDGWFGKIVPAFENEHGEIKNMFRNNR